MESPESVDRSLSVSGAGGIDGTDAMRLGPCVLCRFDGACERGQSHQLQVNALGASSRCHVHFSVAGEWLNRLATAKSGHLATEHLG